MIKRKTLNLILFAISMVFMLTVTLVSFFAVHPVPVLKPSDNTEVNGKPTNGIHIEDLGKLQMLTSVLYTPNEYTSPGQIAGEPVTLSEQSELAPRGTIQFVFFNLDPMNDDFIKKKEKLRPYLEGDSSWHFSLYLPAVFSACNIYINRTLEMRIGDLANYDFITYSSYQGTTDVHKSATQPVYLDLSFYSVRRGIPESLEMRAKVVTIHYESGREIVSAFTDMPLVGKLSAVTRTVSSNVSSLIAGFIASALVAVILGFNCFLKRSLLPLPQFVSTLGVGGVMLGKFFLFNECAFPYLWLSVITASAWIILISTTVDVRVKIGKFPVWICSTALAGAGLVLNLLLGYFSVLQSFVPILLRAILILVGAGLFAASVISALENTYSEGLKGTVAVIMLCFCMAFVPYTMPVVNAPQTWLLFSLLIITALTQFSFFTDLERRNRQLTNNLQNEVARQTQSLQSMLDDRDKILRYLSHDLKKPVSSIRRYLTDLKQQATQDATLGKLEVVERKVEDIENNLRNIAVFSRHTFAAEKSSVLDINEILRKQYALLAPDCEANNILLHILECNVSAFAKRDTLISVLNNLIFNAIEHANCKNIYLNATTSRGTCKITVIDDGKGIQEEYKVFEAYRTEKPNGENLGLGLYLCQQHLLEMGGDLKYERKNGKTVFTVILPVA